MAQNAENIVIAGRGFAYTAPFGTTLPGSVSDSLDNLFVDAGHVSEDGAKVNYDPSIETWRGWAQRSPVLAWITDDMWTVEFTAAEIANPNNMEVAYHGIDVEETDPGEYKIAPSTDGVLEYHSLVIDIPQDIHGHHYMIVVRRGFASGAVESDFARSGPALLPISFGALVDADDEAPLYILSDNPSFADFLTT